MTREECMKQRNDVEWLKHPEWWAQRFGVCPLRNRSQESKDIGDWKLGFMHYGTEKPTVYLGCIYLVGNLDKLQKEVYDSIEDLVAAGWGVD